MCVDARPVRTLRVPFSELKNVNTKIKSNGRWHCSCYRCRVPRRCGLHRLYAKPWCKWRRSQTSCNVLPSAIRPWISSNQFDICRPFHLRAFQQAIAHFANNCCNFISSYLATMSFGCSFFSTLLNINLIWQIDLFYRLFRKFCICFRCFVIRQLPRFHHAFVHFLRHQRNLIQRRIFKCRWWMPLHGIAMMEN